MRSSDDSAGRRLWALPAWRYAFPAAVVSRLGDLVFDLTVVLWISTDIARGETWAPAAVGGVLIAAALPVLLVGPIAGVYADRTDRQRLLVRSNTVQALAIASLVLIPLLGDRISRPFAMVWIYAAIVVTNAAGQFFTQARNVMIAKTIPDDLRTSAYSRQGSANSLLAIAGPPLAAPLFLALGATAALTVNALSFVLSSFLLGRFTWSSAPEERASGQSFWTSLSHGVRTVTRYRMLGAVAFALTVITFATGMINVLEVFFVTDVLHERAELLGWLLMSFAIGTLVGTLLAPRLERHIGPATIFVWSFLLVGACVVVYSRMTSFAPAVVLFFLLAMPLGAANTVLMPMVMRSIPSELLGRATVVITVFPTVASLTSMAITSWVVSTAMRDLDVTVGGLHFGPIDTVFTISGLLMIGTGLLVWRPVTTASRLTADEVAQAEASSSGARREPPEGTMRAEARPGSATSRLPGRNSRTAS
ncbi:MFS transporter [Luteipulveratus sp. YIM 133132]|uniref:MFS transporter n=1 Tax=Luteipulveratus flavus TaxID=3031728 RepID=A0ABT6C2V9_9MICO|nr:MULTISPECIES: MFS transporter [unclassified Luteipulveratus]MDE9367020.1 MFS transporter [Luteipulveratus sp. YIM 133132]MDF8263005.1 MFS transporter [Luteipulveratus sp. YIM 133296]